MSSNTDSEAPRASELTGDVVRRGDKRYEAARLGWNQLFSHHPEAVVFCSDTTDVVNALTWARQNDVPVRVRSGRHCLEGWNAVDDGLVIDVSRIKSADIDTVSGTATVGAGLNQLEAVKALGEVGFAAPTGIEGTVGLVGATLGGGFGLLTRDYGLASDNLIAAEVVVASGTGGAEVLTADETNNCDLLWALRGAGNGNFGIVTSLTYSIHPLTQTVYMSATWPNLGDLQEAFDVWQRSAPHAENRLTSQLEIHPHEFVLIGLLAGGTEAEVRQMLAPTLSVGNPKIVVEEANWADIYTGFQIPITDEAAFQRFTSQFVYEPFPPEALGLIGSFMSNAPTTDCNYFTNAFGGAVKSSEPAGGSVFAHRQALFYAEPCAAWGTRGGSPASADPLTAECLSWVADFHEALSPYVDGAYVNVPNAGIPDWETAYWGRNVDRLSAVKARYDPHNVFSYEQSVPLARSSSLS